MIGRSKVPDHAFEVIRHGFAHQATRQFGWMAYFGDEDDYGFAPTREDAAAAAQAWLDARRAAWEAARADVRRNLWRPRAYVLLSVVGFVLLLASVIALQEGIDGFAGALLRGVVLAFAVAGWMLLVAWPLSRRLFPSNTKDRA